MYIMKNKKLFWSFIIILFWQIASMSGTFSPLILPSPYVVMKAFIESIMKGELLSETVYSLIIIFEGLFIGIFLSLFLALVSRKWKVTEGLIETLIAIAHPLPGIALLPLIILWLGTGRTSVVFVIVHSVLWPMLLNIMTGFKTIPKVFTDVGQNFGVKGVRLIGTIYIPASMPFIISGLRIGWARSWRALISAEMIFGAVGGKGGLGWYIFKERVFMDTAGMFAALIVIVLIGMLVEDLIFERLEANTIVKWGMTIK